MLHNSKQLNKYQCGKANAINRPWLGIVYTTQLYPLMVLWWFTTYKISSGGRYVAAQADDLAHHKKLHHDKTKKRWWYTYPPEKYEFVGWGYEIPNIWKFIKHDWNHHDSAKKRRQFHVLLPPLRFLRTASTCPPRSQAQLRMVLEPVEDRRIRTSCLAFLGLNAQQSGLPPWDSCDRRIFLVKAEVLQHPTMWGPLDS